MVSVIVFSATNVAVREHQKSFTGKEMLMVQSRLRLFAVHMAVVLIAGLGAAIVAPSPASASCSHAHSDIDSRSDLIVGTSALSLRTGPHVSCTRITTISGWVDLHCFDVGDEIFGNSTWSFVRWGSYYGWVSDYYLQNNGSMYHC